MPKNEIVNRQHLFFTEGSSDKEYLATMEKVGDLYVVNFAFGRRGTPLKSGTKTSTPVTLEAAGKIFSKLVNEKLAKGYTPEASGAAFTHTGNEGRVSGHLPQLSNPIEEEDTFGYIHSPEWVAQEKHNGERRALRVTDGNPSGINRRGLIVPLPTALSNTVSSLGRQFTLDGEAMGNESLVAFDIVEYEGRDLRGEPFAVRFDILTKLVGTADEKNLMISPLARTPDEKRALIKRIRESGGEGVIFRRLDAAYAAGRPASGGNVLKFKFYQTATVKVTGVNLQRSISIGVRQSESSNEIVAVGNVTVPANQSIPAVGDLIEVRYLDANRGGSLYQPTLIGPRRDLDTADSADSLHYRDEARDETFKM
jgi:bifunctional non-homologous end joining protein LigD